jgi:signal peptidase II
LAEPRDRRLVTALALLVGGAVGNLVDRVYSPRGVVDFIDLGIGDARFWTFNVADMGISAGAVLLAITLWRRRHAPAAPIATR